jgi:excisionase family DNA binding protein
VAHDRITLHEAAARLGVHYMTVYRYVRTGRLPATRDGVQWLVDPADLARVTPGRQERGRARAAAPSTLAARLIAGDEAGSWSLLE